MILDGTHHLQSIMAIYHREYIVFNIFNSYSATYSPISMKLCMLVNNVKTHMLVNFCEVLSFPLGFVGFWVHFYHTSFVNDPVIEKQMIKFNFFDNY